MAEPAADKPKPARKPRKAAGPPPRRGPLGRVLRWALRGVAGLGVLYAALILAFSVIPPPINLYQAAEAWRLGGIRRDWVAWEAIAPVMARSAVAAEDANFCLHWGFDMAAIRDALDGGGSRGASTISQQVVKNVFLWHGQGWTSRAIRKGFEAVLTPVVELVWTKRRLLHVYLNVAEFGEGVFGVQAAARHHFGVDAAALTPQQAARLAAVLPDPKGRNAADPGPQTRRRAAAIADGAETIRADGRAACFEG
jgi:monofunctional biosynthetic peptidoglycan transglycosylase